MKEKMLKSLEDYWTSGRDNQLILDFIEHFFNSDQPERSKREDIDEEEIYDRGSWDNILC